MSTTKSILNVMATPVLTNVPFLARTNMIKQSSILSADGLDAVSNYVLASGDEDFPLTAQIGVYRKPTALNGRGQVVTTFGIKTYANEVDDTSGEELWNEPVTATITVRMPGSSPTLDTADFMSLVFNLASMIYAGVDGTNNPTTTVVDKIKYGEATIS